MRPTDPTHARPLWPILLSLPLVIFLPPAGFARAHGDHDGGGDRVAATSTDRKRPTRVNTFKADKARTRVVGHMVAHDDAGFRVLTSEGKTLDVRWDELTAPQAFKVRKDVLDPRDGQAFVRLGQDLLDMPDGQPYATKAFQQAQRVDPSLRDQIQRVKADFRRARQERQRQQGHRARTTPAAKGELRPTDPAPALPGVADDAEDADAHAHAPHVTPPPRPAVSVESVEKRPRPGTGGGGDSKPVEAEPWPKLNVREQADLVEELNLFAEETEKTLRLNLRLRETRYFLFYTDLPQQEADKWATLLDRMYGRLADLFETGKENGRYVNIWKGKALVFVFSRPDDYRQFQIKMHDTNPKKSVGMCHSFDDGAVHIAFYRQPDEMTFAHVLVHESVHGFLHRYRTPEWLPSWLNEGLAEVIAAELVPQANRRQNRPNIARSAVLTHGGLAGMLDADEVQGWQYPVAETLCSFMISQNKEGFVLFVDGIKDGLTWEQSLHRRYGVKRQRLVEGYGASMELSQLKE